jgi:hypothetical protein
LLFSCLFLLFRKDLLDDYFQDSFSKLLTIILKHHLYLTQDRLHSLIANFLFKKGLHMKTRIFSILTIITLLIANKTFAQSFGPPVGEGILKYCNDISCQLPPLDVVENEITQFDSLSELRTKMILNLELKTRDLIASTSNEYKKLSEIKSLSIASQKAFASLANQQNLVIQNLDQIFDSLISRVSLDSESALVLKQIHDFLAPAWQTINSISDPIAREGAKKEYAKRFSQQFHSLGVNYKLINKFYVQNLSLKKQLESEKILTPVIDLQAYVAVNFQKPKNSYHDECALTYEADDLTDETQKEIARQLHRLNFIQPTADGIDAFYVKRHYLKVQYHEIQQARFLLSGSKTNAPLKIDCTNYGVNPRNASQKIEPTYIQRSHTLSIGDYTYSGWGMHGVQSNPNKVLRILSGQ